MKDTEMITRFQNELKMKLQFKASSKVSIDWLLFKAFRFFDLNNNGHLPQSQFFRAIAKCGVLVDSHNLDCIFQHYATQTTTGTALSINYRNFIENLLFCDKDSNGSRESREVEQSRREVQKERKLGKVEGKGEEQHSPWKKLKEQSSDHLTQNYEKIMEDLADWLRKDGICGLLSFSNKLKLTDPNKTHTINYTNLHQCLPHLSQTSIKQIAHHFNPVKNGQLNYAELVYEIKGSMCQQRQRLVREFFVVLDDERKGEILISKMMKLYGIGGSQMANFRKAIELYCKFQSIQDGIFTEEDFNDFFQFISFGLVSDENFWGFVQRFYSEKLVTQSISNRSPMNKLCPLKQLPMQSMGILGESRVQSKPQQSYEQEQKQKQSHKSELLQQKQNSSHVSAQSRRILVQSKPCRTEQSRINNLLSRVRKILIMKGTKGFLQFERLLKINDENCDGRVSIEQFKRVLYDQKIGISQAEACQLFSAFDDQNCGLVIYSNILHSLKPEISPSRLNTLSHIWQKIKINENETSLQRIKNILNFRLHPDVQSGRKQGDQIWREILQTIGLIQQLNGNRISDIVKKQDFQEYCSYMSISINNDQLFDSIVQSFWKVDSINSQKQKEEYAGSRRPLITNKKNGYKDGDVFQNAPYGTFNIPTNYKTENQKL